jgi:hypothetical protein
MPHNSFQAIVAMAAQEDALFRRWREGAVDAIGQPAAPLPLLILSVLRYLGRGWLLDDLSESIGISEEVIRVFLHSFLLFGSTILFDEYVIAPTTPPAEAAHHTREYFIAGLPGCVGSCDATHIVFEKIKYRLRQSHLGFKSSHTSQAFNITVNKGGVFLQQQRTIRPDEMTRHLHCLTTLLLLWQKEEYSRTMTSICMRSPLTALLFKFRTKEPG